jgi:hypothetical protein
MVARGRFYAEDAPIRLSASNLQTFFSSQSPPGVTETGDTLAALIASSVAANDHVFAREEGDAGPVVVTTKRGVPPARADETTFGEHTFRTRLNEAAREPTEEDLRLVRGVAREIPEIVMATPEPVTAVFPDEVSAPGVFEPEEGAAAPAAESTAEEPAVEVAAPPAAAPKEIRIRLGDAVIDLSGNPDLIVAEHGTQFAEMLGNYLAEDFRFVTFGGEYYLEDRLERLSKGQLRDIKEYINERNEPLTDEELLSDALRRPLQNADYSLWRFTINYRLSREKKDFRFVGTAEDRLWATTALPPIGQSVRKASEIAQDYRYLTDPELADADPVRPASGTDASGRLELVHTLTWYESENGVLPVGAGMQLLLPNPLLEDQSVVVLRIQDPQNFATYMAELRLGASGRGTYIAGLEEFFQNTLVPGAVFTLVQGSAQNEFTIEYDRRPAQEARLLQWDPRKQRWFFGPVVYECPVEGSALLSEERVGELAGRKRATDAERRRPDTLLQTAFELVGEHGGDGSRTALVDDLTPVMNIERPFSRAYVESIVSSSQYPQFAMEDPAIGLVSFRG